LASTPSGPPIPAQALAESTICARLARHTAWNGDFMVWFARFLWPEFRMVDGRVFVVTLFDSRQYHAILNSGETNEGAQYWMNLLEITGVFAQLSHPQARELAEIVAATWNAKLLADLGEVRTRARVVDDWGTGEVFVTIGDMATEPCRSTV
jgi:hypothetical protein